MISQQWIINKMEWEEAKVGIGSLGDLYMLDRKKKRTILNKGQLEKNDGNSMVSWKLGKLRKAPIIHTSFIQHTPWIWGYSEGKAIGFDAWLSLIMFV